MEYPTKKREVANIPKNQTGYYVLSLLLCLFIVFPVSVPEELARLVDTVIGKIVVAIIVMNGVGRCRCGCFG